jgi:FkbM family methyltransferase
MCPTSAAARAKAQLSANADTRNEVKEGVPPPLTRAERIGRFLRQPAQEKCVSIARSVRQRYPELTVPLRLPFGAWWLAKNSALDRKLLFDEYEAAEIRLVEKLVQPGMTVADIGAHHGLYTLLMSKRVGWRGKVIAFEPSPRERKRLVQHVRINACMNVTVQPFALCKEEGLADLFVVEGAEDWCNSLRPPLTSEPTRWMRVEALTLDDAMERLGTSHVDFIKIDAEGAELAILQGASRILRRASRPAILVEVRDLRTKPWDYPAREIVRFLAAKHYHWFAIANDGGLAPIAINLESYDANLAALPEEQLDRFAYLIK